MRRIILLSSLLVAFALSSYAESNWKPVVYGGGGLSLPTGNYRKDFKTGWNAGGGVGVQYKSLFELSGNVFYSRTPLDQTKFLATQPSSVIGVSGGAERILSVTGQVKYFIPTGAGMTKVKPYLLGRLGVAHLTESNMTLNMVGGTSTVNTFSGTSKFTYGFGAGTNFEIKPNLDIWVEGKFAGINTPVHKTDFVPIQAGLRYMFGSTE